MMILSISLAALLATASAVRVQRAAGHSSGGSYASSSSNSGGGGTHFGSLRSGDSGGNPFQANYGYCPPGCGGAYGGGFPPGFVPPSSNPADFQNFMDQYMRAMQQFHSQVASSGGNGYGYPGSYSFAGNQGGGGFTGGNAGVPNYGGGAGFTGGASPGFTGGAPGYNAGGGSGYPNSNDIAGQVGASASGSISPTGGYGSANVSPAAPGGLDVRFGAPQPASGPVNSVSGSVPPPAGGTVGVFSSSSSSSSNVDGKQTSYKTASVGFNDNGKVTTYTAHDP